MSRDIGTLSTELDKFSLRTALLVHLDWYSKDEQGVWVSTPLYLTNAGQNIVVNGTMYMATGSLGSVTGVEEGFDLSAYSVTLTLSGIPTELVQGIFNDISFTNGYTNRPAFIYTAFLDDNYDVIDQPVLVFAGQMDSASMEMSDTLTIQLEVQSRLINWETTRGGRFNDDTQRARFPLDTGFRYVNRLQETELAFGGGMFI